MRRRLAEFATGAAAALVVFGAVPAVLVALVGVPFPRHLSRATVLSSHGLFDLLAVVAWVAWAACCWPLVRSVAGRVRRRDATTPADARLPEWLATRIAAAVLAVGALGTSGGAAAGALPPRPAPVASAPAALSALRPPTGAVPPPSGPATDAAPLATQYTVVPGDSLWSIAQQLYGDGGDWPAIAAANLGRVMDDGNRFVDPSLVMPGWVLSVPPLAGSGGAAGTAPLGAAGPVTEASVTGTGPPGPSPRTATTDAHSPTAVHRGRQAVPRPDRRPSRRQPPEPVPLPELAALGLGVLVAAALARRARRARRLAALRRGDGEPTPVASEEAATAGSLLAPFLGAPVLDWLELANRHLGAVLADGPAPSAARLVRVGPDGIEVTLTEPVGSAPEGWERRGDRAWFLPAATDLDALSDVALGHDPWMALLLPVGDNDDGTWLVPLSPGACLPVLGPEADAMVSAMVAALESWAWSEDVVVTGDPEAGVLRDPGRPDGRSPHATPVLFVGDPGGLSAEARARAAVVTTRPLPASDLTVVIDARAASLHPLGVTVRPSLLRPAEQRAVGELVAGATPPGTGGPAPDGDGAAHRPPRHRTSPRPVATRGVTVAQLSMDGTPVQRATAGVAQPGAGVVEVRLLTAVPRVDGLVEELDPKRARRATELVAYLALHHPDPVTSDRLRTRVLGSADADAASKTLFNTVGAARRALGLDPAGEPLLPPASKSGHYRTSARVTTDVARAEELVAAAEEVEEDDQAIALLRAALDLVEGEPLAGVLTGYGWWGAEGHERRVAAMLVDGACRMARLAADRGYLDLARWGLEQARLVEPYSEVLARAAMRLAAVSGDAERLRREWVECQRWVDELDPGGFPSETTERLYADLRRRVPAGAGSDTEG